MTPAQKSDSDLEMQIVRVVKNVRRFKARLSKGGCKDQGGKSVPVFMPDSSSWLAHSCGLFGEPWVGIGRMADLNRITDDKIRIPPVVRIGCRVMGMTRMCLAAAKDQGAGNDNFFIGAERCVQSLATPTASQMTSLGHLREFL